MRGLLVVVLVSAFVGAALAETAPLMTWSFTAPSALDGQGEDWLYGVVSRKDGGYVVCGYTEVVGKQHRSAVVGLVSKDKQLSSEQIFGGVKGEATLFDITETDSAYIAVGHSNGELIVARMAKGAKFTASWKVFPAASLGMQTGSWVEGHSVRPAGGGGVVIAGWRMFKDKKAAMVVRLDGALKPVKSFGGGGAVILGAPIGAFARTVRPDGRGFVLAGGASPKENDPFDTDIWVARINGNGVLTWSRTFSKQQLSGFKAPLRTPLCTGQPAITGNEEASAVEPLPGGGYMVAIQVNYVGEWAPPGCPEVISPSYVDLDGGLLRLAPDGTQQWARFVRRFGGIDFRMSLVLNDGGVTLVGNDGTSGTEVRVAAVHTTLSGALAWQETYLIAGDRNDCPFGLASTTDGGLVIAGNNDLEGEDYFLMKLGPNKQ